MAKIKELSSLEKFQNTLIDRCANLIENMKSEVYCECDQYCSCSSGMVYPSEAADMIRKLKVVSKKS